MVSTGKSRKMYILLDTGSSNTILSDKYLGQVTSIKNLNLTMHYMDNGHGQWKTRGTWL